MPKLTINGQTIDAPAGSNLIQAAKSLGIEIPHFCYHPGLSVAGNCRMCLVEIEKAPKLQIACNTPVTDGMVVFTESEKVKKARAGVMEFLLLNHPIDCPICDCAGECYLQDYYMEHDLRASRLQEGKNKKQKALDIGPHVMLDKERCVLCSRCVRFTDEISESHELGIFGRGSTEEIGLAPGMVLDNPYSGCVVDLCPVGALTDKDFRFKSRPWFLKETETVCAGCSMGCNIVLNTNTNPYNKVGQNRAYRIFPRENAAVNEWWMCDEGRYSYKGVDEGRQAMATLNGQPVPLAQALGELKNRLGDLGGDFSRLGLLLSPQLTNEEAWALKWLGETLRCPVASAADLQTPGRSDGWLIQADKNPNARGLADQGLGSGQALLQRATSGELKALFLAETVLTEAQMAALQGKLLLFGLHTHSGPWTPSLAVDLPRAHYFEQDGSFTNVQGRVQRVRKALTPLGESQPAWTLAFYIAEALGHHIPASTPAELFAKIAEAVPAYRGLTLEGLGSLGVPTFSAEVGV
jgi:NADH-quinone oxidoreductase subunit G